MRAVSTSEDLVTALLERARQSANAASLARELYKQRDGFSALSLRFGGSKTPKLTMR